MLRKIVYILVVSCLSVLLLFGGTAKEFVHLFAHHEDTIHHTDHVCPPGEAHFEQEHHHCSFLSFLLEPFHNDAQIPYVALQDNRNYKIVHLSPQEKCILRDTGSIRLRGPPVFHLS